VFSPGAPVFSNDKADHHDITEILLNVALSTIILTSYYFDVFRVRLPTADVDNKITVLELIRS
jgi:hypothetical protein